MDEKTRTLVHFNERPYSTWYQPDWTTNTDPGLENKGTSSPITSLQTTQSRGHAWPSAVRAKTDVGGNFTTTRVKSIVTSRTSPSTGRGFGHQYTGTEFSYSPNAAITEAFNLVTPSTEIKLMQKGSSAIAKCIPTNPVADAGTFVGELKSGLPQLVGRELFKTKFKDYRKVGGEYLNVEFGWKPLISDLQKFGKAAIESERIIEQLHRDSGKDVRRKYTFPDEVVTGGPVYSSNRQAWLGGLNMYPGIFHQTTGAKLQTTWKVVTKTWFSGCFTYHLNLGNTLQDRLARQAAEARKLFGVELTPATVWNLAPWSWAVDWEGNIGDVLHNVSRFSQDGLVMRYGYIMQSKTVEIDYILPWQGRLNRSPREDLRLTIIAESKVRRRATPFGFGFDMTALTGRQSAILGALGISRGPRHR